MFKIDMNPEFWWPIKVTRPSASEAGVLEDHVFEGRFRWLSDEDRKAYAKKFEQPSPDMPALAAEVLLGFRAVHGADGQPLPDTPENLSLLLRETGVALAATSAFWASCRAVSEKNSSALH